MTGNDVFERSLARALEERAAWSAPNELLDRVLDETARTRQRRAWRVPDHWLSPLAAIRVRTALRTAATVALVILIIAAFVVGLALSSQRRLPPPFGPAHNGLIAYTSGQRVFVAQPDGTDPHPLTPVGVQAYEPTWSPDGTRLAWWSAGDAAGGWWRPSELVVADADGSHRRIVAGQLFYAWDTPATRIAWAPDSFRLAYAVDGPEDTSQIYLAQIDQFGGSPVGAPSPAGTNPTWSHDGQTIAFEGGTNSENRGLYFMDANGGNVRGPVIFAPHGDGPVWWDADDRVSAFCDTEMISIAPDDRPSDRTCFVFDLAAGVSPDELHAVYVGPGTGPGTALGDASAQNLLTVYVDDGAGGETEVTLRTPPISQLAPTWSPDSSKLIVVAQDGAHAEVVGLDGVVVELPLDGGVFHGEWQRLAP